MKVLLLKNIPKVGKKDEIVVVADGYATNVLFVKKMAIPATEKAIADMHKKNNNIATHNKIQSELFEKEIEKLGGELVIAVKANEKGSLFSRVDQKIIAKAFKGVGVFLEEKQIILSGEIKEKGTHTIELVDVLGKKYPFSIKIT